MAITWDDVGRTTTPGVYEVSGRKIQVDSKQIEKWRDEPHFVFFTTWWPPGQMYILGQYVDPDEGYL